MTTKNVTRMKQLSICQRSVEIYRKKSIGVNVQITVKTDYDHKTFMNFMMLVSCLYSKL